MIDRHEWDRYSADEQFEYLQLTEKRIVELEKILDIIPECPEHGGCIPHAVVWVERMVYISALDDDDVLIVVSRKDDLGQKMTHVDVYSNKLVKVSE